MKSSRTNLYVDSVDRNGQFKINRVFVGTVDVTDQLSETDLQKLAERTSQEIKTRRP